MSVSPGTTELLQRAAKNSLKEQAAQIAFDIGAVDQAMWERRGGISGWLDELDQIYKEERRAGKNKVALDILKMHLDVKVAAQKAGQRASDDMTDEELEATILRQINILAKQNPDVLSQVVLAKAKDASPPAPLPRSYDFLR
jgi:hypothetical protein